MLSKNIKFGVVSSFAIIYFISFWLLTIGYFTPNWLLINLESGAYDNEWDKTKPGVTTNFWHYGNSCNSLGVVTNSCDGNIYNWFKSYDIHNTSTILGLSFKLMTTAFVVVFTNASLLITAFVFDLFKYSLYMSLLSISFGVFYPVAAILVLVATIYVEASFKYDTGFSAMICTIAGGLMLIFYVSLIFYDRQYIKRSLTSWPNGNKHKHSSGSKEIGRDHASKLDQSLFETTLKKTGVNPVREWGLRRL